MTDLFGVQSAARDGYNVVGRHVRPFIDQKDSIDGIGAHISWHSVGVAAGARKVSRSKGIETLYFGFGPKPLANLNLFTIP